NHIGCTPVYIDKDGVIYKGLYDLDFDVEEKSLPKDEPDYWEKLKHQYAGMAMQGICANYNDFTKNNDGSVSNTEMICENAKIIATALVNRLKEEEK
ncbi:MAG: hypothetical protein II273_01770, partial [Lachnospiraceae bacterium]|nr:hypothetical protein [Lachnospiraceae bacterium]